MFSIINGLTAAQVTLWRTCNFVFIHQKSPQQTCLGQTPDRSHFQLQPLHPVLMSPPLDSRAMVLWTDKSSVGLVAARRTERV